MVFRQHVLIITTLTIIFNFSVWIFHNFNLIPSIKVSGKSDRLAENITDKINTLRLYTTCKDRYEMNTTYFNYLRLNLCQESRNQEYSFLANKKQVRYRQTDKQTDRRSTYRRSKPRRGVDLENCFLNRKSLSYLLN